MSQSNDKVSIATPVSYQKQKLYIEDLEVSESPESCERDLKAFLSKYGTIIDIKLLKNQQHKYYAFVTFQDDESVELLLAMKLKFGGEELKLSRARKPKVKTTSERYIEGATKIFVGAIPSKVTLEEFQTYFEQYGPIDDICLPMKNKSKSINRGHGFVNYVYPLSAKLAINHYKDHYLRAKWVEVRIAKPRNDTSPNYKAFSTAHTINTEPASKHSQNGFQARIDARDPYVDFLSPTEVKDGKTAEKEKRSYFSLGNTFYRTSEKGSYTDKLNNFVQRFSHDLTLDARIKAELLSHKKRFSMGTDKQARSKPTEAFGLNRYEKIMEKDEKDLGN